MNIKSGKSRIRNIILIVVSAGRFTRSTSRQSRFQLEAAYILHIPESDLKYTPNKHTYRLTLRLWNVKYRKTYEIVVVSSLMKCRHVRVSKKGIRFLLNFWQKRK